MSTATDNVRPGLKVLAVFRTNAGETTYHLSRGDREKIGNNTVLPSSAKIKIYDTGTVITNELTLGTGTCKLTGQEIVDAINDLIARGKPILDITDGDPLDPRQQEARKVKEAQARFDALEADNARLKLELEQKTGGGNVAKLKEELAVLEAKRFACPFCPQRFDKGTVAKRKAGWQEHVAHCKKRPTDENTAKQVRDRLQAQQPHTPTPPKEHAGSSEGLPPGT